MTSAVVRPSTCWCCIIPACRPPKPRWNGCAIRGPGSRRITRSSEGGTIYALLPEARRAWHAGISFGPARATSMPVPSASSWSIPAMSSAIAPFAEAQIVALTGLCQEILARHAIPPWRVLGHSDVAPDRAKKIPANCFPGKGWRRLASGFGPPKAMIRAPQQSPACWPATAMIRCRAGKNPDRLSAPFPSVLRGRHGRC